MLNPCNRAQPSSVSMRRGSKVPGLKHLELIDGVRGDVVRADEPTLRLIPAVGTVS